MPLVFTVRRFWRALACFVLVQGARISPRRGAPPARPRMPMVHARLATGNRRACLLIEGRDRVRVR